MEKIRVANYGSDADPDFGAMDFEKWCFENKLEINAESARKYKNEEDIDFYFNIKEYDSINDLLDAVLDYDRKKENNFIEVE